MSNKSWKQLNILDKKLQRMFPVGMESGIKMELHLHCGFELFNTRPYHNYETWSQGYSIRASRPATNRIDWLVPVRPDDPNLIDVSEEDLDDAIAALEKEMIRKGWISGPVVID